MKTLVAFELRKILGNKAGMAACALALALLVLLAVGNLCTATAIEYDTGKTVRGLEAQQALKQRTNMLAGVLSDERMEADKQVYAQAEELAATVDGFGELSSAAVIDAYGVEFWQNTKAVLNNGYYQRVMNTLNAAGVDSVNLQSAARAWLEGEVGALWVSGAPYIDTENPYSEAEQRYWLAKAEAVQWPVEFGYADGWHNAFSWVSFPALLAVAICIALSGVYAGEYQGRTAAVLLPTRRGKRALPAAKILAALIFATAMWWIGAALSIGINLVVCGADGGSLPMQIWDFSSPYALSCAGAVCAVYGLGYLITLGMVAVTLLLSAVLRSSMPVAVIPLAAVLLGMIGLFIGPVAKAAALLPLGALNYAFDRLVSYAAGPLVADLPTLVACIYGVCAGVHAFCGPCLPSPPSGLGTAV